MALLQGVRCARTPRVLGTALLLVLSSHQDARAARIVDIDYQGYAWVDGEGSSSPGAWNLLLITDGVDPVFGVDLSSAELSFWITGMTRELQEDLGGGLVGTLFLGGTVSARLDTARDHDFGIFPPNATAPSSFLNGEPFLEAEIGQLVVYEDTNNGIGSAEMLFNDISGPAVQKLPSNVDYVRVVLGFVFETASFRVPDGYDYAIDGKFSWIPSLSVETTTFSRVKALFR